MTKLRRAKFGKSKMKVDESERKFPSRGYAFILTKNNEHISYKLVEKPDGYYFEGNGKSVQVTKSTRNYMFAEGKAEELFREDVKEFQEKGKYKDSYSSSWYAEGSSGLNYNYDKKPKAITPIKNYGTHDYTLGFETNEDIREVNGKYIYDTVYHAINWRRETGKSDVIYIKSSTYKDGKKVSESKGDEVSVDDKEGVKRLKKEFREKYESEKKRLK